MLGFLCFSHDRLPQFGNSMSQRHQLRFRFKKLSKCLMHNVTDVQMDRRNDHMFPVTVRGSTVGPSEPNLGRSQRSACKHATIKPPPPIGPPISHQDSSFMFQVTTETRISCWNSTSTRMKPEVAKIGTRIPNGISTCGTKDGRGVGISVASAALLLMTLPVTLPAFTMVGRRLTRRRKNRVEA